MQRSRKREKSDGFFSTIEELIKCFILLWRNRNVAAAAADKKWFKMQAQYDYIASGLQRRQRRNFFCILWLFILQIDFFFSFSWTWTLGFFYLFRTGIWYLFYKDKYSLENAIKTARIMKLFPLLCCIIVWLMSTRVVYDCGRRSVNFRNCSISIKLISDRDYFTHSKLFPHDRQLVAFRTDLTGFVSSQDE